MFFRYLVTGRAGLQDKVSSTVPLAFCLKLDSSESKQGEALSLGQGDRNQSSEKLGRQDCAGSEQVLWEMELGHTVSSELFSFPLYIGLGGASGLEKEELPESWDQNCYLTVVWSPCSLTSQRGGTVLNTGTFTGATSEIAIQGPEPLMVQRLPCLWLAPGLIPGILFGPLSPASC